MCREVVQRVQAADTAQGLDHVLGDRALVEGIAALAGDRAQGLAEFGPTDHVAGERDVFRRLHLPALEAAGITAAENGVGFGACTAGSMFFTITSTPAAVARSTVQWGAGWVSGAPGAGTSNLHMEPGDVSPADLMADIKSGFYVTELIGMGVNGLTGDYSQGASGFVIEDGELRGAVSEVTIAGNLKDMFAALVPANDLQFRYGTNVPTIRIDGMMLAGD